MPKLPQIETSPGKRSAAPRGVVFAVYAPFGTDEALSRFPNRRQAPVERQALVKALQKVAALGVNVSALLDLHDDDSYLVEIPAHCPEKMAIVSAWKQDMSSRQALAGFLRRTHQRFPHSALVLSIEGHGGAFLPEIDFARITSSSLTQGSDGGRPRRFRWIQTEGGSRFEPDDGLPALPINSPVLPINSPVLAASRLPMSTWSLGAALSSAIAAGVPRPAVINFANCFNASVEHLHTVAAHADFATGYANYNFFTAGQTYPKVFSRLKRAGSASAEQLARWFALENGKVLKAKKNHPTVGATVDLSRMTSLAKAIDAMALALTAALKTGVAAERKDALDRINRAARQAQHYDTQQGFELAVPDQFMDIESFALQVLAQFPPGSVPNHLAISNAATAVRDAASGLWQYGDFDRPYLDENQIWDFRSTDLGLNIFFPDPDREGLWDWRSPYYLSGTVDSSKPPAQRQVIDFLADRKGASPPWVAFIKEYHLDVPFKGLLAARPLLFPIFNAPFKPKLPHPVDAPTGQTGQTSSLS